MILNGYAVVAGSVALLRFILGVSAAGAGLAALVRLRRASTPEARSEVEHRVYLLVLLGFVLLGLTLVSWPLLYAVLYSYIPQWPGAMCIYGVMQVGAGGTGSSRHLPDLIRAAQVGAPLALFLAGLFVSVYALHRHAETGRLLGVLVSLSALVGLSSILDAAAVGAYLAVPKREGSLASGCCTLGQVRGAPPGAGAPAEPSWLLPAYYGLSAVLLLALQACRLRRPADRWALMALLGLASLAAWVGAAFLREVFAPRVLGLPFHQCAYDLVQGAPETLPAVALFAWGTFCVGWAAAVGWIGKGLHHVGEQVATLLGSGAIGYLYSIVVVSSALLAAG